MSVEWHYLVHDRVAGSNKQPLTGTEVFDHPLKPIMVTALDNRHSRKLSILSKTSSSNSSTISLEPLGSVLDGCDPLSLFARQDEIDPLSRMAEEYHSSSAAKKASAKKPTTIDSQTSITSASAANNTSTASSTTNDAGSRVEWNTRRSAILNRFTTAEKLSIVTSFLTGGEMLKHSQTSIAEKVRHRLEQLDDCDEGAVVHQMLDLTQHDYMHKIDQLNHELVQAWNGDQRVKALKIAIQCAKLLADTSVMQFYPSQFVLITDILDNFGKLVFERLRTKAAYVPPGGPASAVPTALPENFTPDMVPAAAKETCENWFYKIASIRELLPRLYVEIAILRCYSFLARDAFGAALQRLTHIIRGIGDPLVAAYVRCYLCRVGMTVSPDRTYVKSNLDDMLFVYHTMFAGGIRSEIARQRLDIGGYVALYQPAVDWIMQALAAQGSDILLDNIIKQCQDKKNNGLLLNSILTTFRPALIAARALPFVNIIANSTTEGIGRAALFRALGACLNQCAPPADQVTPVLHGTWKMLGTLTAHGEYMQCVDPWSQYVSQHFGQTEVNALMADIIGRMAQQPRAVEMHYAELHSIAERLVTHTVNFDGLLTADCFLQFIDLFQKDVVRLDVCKRLLVECRNRGGADNAPIADPVVINALMHICRVLSDSVTEMTVDDERRHIGQLIGAFVRRATYGRDIEQQLAFYVDARSAFPNLDAVFVTLVHCVNRLATDTRRLLIATANGNQYQSAQQTRKSAAFTKACAAYCYITIPSIGSVAARMDLYLLSGQVALQNGCLGQADACFEGALNLVAELPRELSIAGGDLGLDGGGAQARSSEPYLVAYLCAFLGTLLVVPDSPERGVLYLPRKLLRCVERYDWRPPAASGVIAPAVPTAAASVYLAAMDMLGAAAQETYPYRIAGVVSNDELYGAGPKFIAECDAMGALVAEQLLAQLKALGDAQQQRAQAALALEMFVRVVFVGDVAKEKVAQLAANLWSLAMKNRGMLDAKLPGKILLRVDRLKGRTLHPDRRRALDELTVKMKVRM